MTTKQQVRHRCDWMNDSQLVAFIESLSSLLFEALEEQRHLNLRHPDLFAKAVALEELLSARAQVIHAHRKNYEGDRERVYFSSVRKPLPMVVRNGMQAPLFEDDYCESGYCAT